MKLAFLLSLLLLVAARLGAAIKLRVHNTECVHKEIPEANSLVSVVLVSGTEDNNPVFYDFEARDPDANIIFSKPEQNDAELAFKTRVPGLHTFCLTLAQRSAGRSSRAARVVQLDLLAGATVEHDKVTDDDVDSLLVDISDLSQRVQKLLSEVRRFKYREARHRRTVESTERRVMRYAIVKLVAVGTIAVLQPVILSRFFKESM